MKKKNRWGLWRKGSSESPRDSTGSDLAFMSMSISPVESPRKWLLSSKSEDSEEVTSTGLLQRSESFMCRKGSQSQIYSLQQIIQSQRVSRKVIISQLKEEGLPNELDNIATLNIVLVRFSSYMQNYLQYRSGCTEAQQDEIDDYICANELVHVVYLHLLSLSEILEFDGYQEKRAWFALRLKGVARSNLLSLLYLATLHELGESTDEETLFREDSIANCLVATMIDSQGTTLSVIESKIDQVIMLCESLTLWPECMDISYAGLGKERSEIISAQLGFFKEQIARIIEIMISIQSDKELNQLLSMRYFLVRNYSAFGADTATTSLKSLLWLRCLGPVWVKKTMLFEGNTAVGRSIFKQIYGLFLKGSSGVFFEESRAESMPEENCSDESLNRFQNKIIRDLVLPFFGRYVAGVQEEAASQNMMVYSIIKGWYAWNPDLEITTPTVGFK